MSIFDKIGEGVKNLTEKANDVVEITKISTKIGAEKNVITTLKTRMGEIIWEQYQAGKVLDPAMLESCEKIKESLLAIDKLEAEINRIKGECANQLCKNCGAEIKKDAKFCLKCGTRVTEEEDKQSAATKQCPACNAYLTPDVKFCPECGYQFDDKEVE
ncbi:hypothetical protein SDC9_116798 [bioreactor metagenome]|uniref:DZANK-type domain-containing protein n=1 Tax=bioreactor metagenome TaxID=1076179 RepID=A0A645BWL8_9ZZZZ|nr:zinc ribbon domain-containing protein [Erysipelotrichaceae bacterium]